MSGAHQQPAILATLQPKILRLRFLLVLGLIVAGTIVLFPRTTLAADEALTIKEVKPSVVQPEETFDLFFSKPVKVTSVKIGNANIEAPFYPKSIATQVRVTVPADIGPGRHQITVLTEGATEPVSDLVNVAPSIIGLRKNKDAPLEFSRVVVAGGKYILQFSEKIPPEIRQKLKVSLDGTKEVFFSIPEDDYLLIEIPDVTNKWTVLGYAERTYSLQVRADGTLLRKEVRVRVQSIYAMYVRASFILLVLILVIYGLCKVFRVPEGRPRYNFLKMLLLEQENQTYSLSRAQFLGWLGVIIWCYLFLYYFQGFVEEKWQFPELGKAIYAFIISLGTLIAAQATSLGQGVKGAGQEHPSLADLVVHGGVLALDRVQQVIWTLVALGMFVRLTVSSYETATGLPPIPTELLALMGLSSAGYLGGKLVRGPGPVIEEVSVPEDGTVTMSIKGRHLSKDGFVWLDGVQLPKDNVHPKADDPDDPVKFAKELEVTLDMTVDAWNSQPHVVTMVNSDAQRADWRTAIKILKVTPDAPDAEQKVRLTIKTAYVTTDATIEAKDGSSFKATQDPVNRNLFTAVVDATWPQQPHELSLTSENQQSTFSYKP